MQDKNSLLTTDDRSGELSLDQLELVSGGMPKFEIEVKTSVDTKGVGTVSAGIKISF